MAGTESISRQDALILISNWIWDLERGLPPKILKSRDFRDGVLDGYYRVKAMLNNLPPAQQWIPCSERLPEEKTDVLLQFKHNLAVGFWEDVFGDGNREWYANSGDGYFTDCDCMEGYDVPIAWMPLPEPWKGE